MTAQSRQVCGLVHVHTFARNYALLAAAAYALNALIFAYAYGDGFVTSSVLTVSAAALYVGNVRRRPWLYWPYIAVEVANSFIMAISAVEILVVQHDAAFQHYSWNFEFGYAVFEVLKIYVCYLLIDAYDYLRTELNRRRALLDSPFVQTVYAATMIAPPPTYEECIVVKTEA